MMDCLQRRLERRRDVECMIYLNGARPFLQLIRDVERDDRIDLLSTGAVGLGTYEPPALHLSLEALLNAGNCTLGSLSAALAIGEVTRDFEYESLREHHSR